ncbi:MAG: hypothetical protein ACRD1L_04600 [Terriglobales bacterium]
MRKHTFAKIWISTAIITFVLEGGLGVLILPTLQADSLVPWHLTITPLMWTVYVVISILGSLAFTYIFLEGYRGKGTMEGIRYGLWVTLLASVTQHLAYAAMLPEGRKIPLEFIIIDLVSFCAAGAVAASLAGKNQVGKSTVA